MVSISALLIIRGTICTNIGSHLRRALASFELLRDLPQSDQQPARGLLCNVCFPPPKARSTEISAILLINRKTIR